MVMFVHLMRRRQTTRLEEALKALYRLLKARENARRRQMVDMICAESSVYYYYVSFFESLLSELFEKERVSSSTVCMKGHLESLAAK